MPSFFSSFFLFSFHLPLLLPLHPVSSHFLPSSNHCPILGLGCDPGLARQCLPNIHKRAVSADTSLRNTKLTNLSLFPLFPFLHDAKRFWIIKESRSWSYHDVQTGPAGSTAHQSVQRNTGTNGDEAITLTSWCIILSRRVSDRVTYTSAYVSVIFDRRTR